MEITAPSPSRPVPATAEAKPTAVTRLFFIDNIRVYLTILVLLHHLMITYAGTGSWYYNEGRQDWLTVKVGSWFCGLDQAYFMGLFLLISAYFVPSNSVEGTECHFTMGQAHVPMLHFLTKGAPALLAGAFTNRVGLDLITLRD